MSFREKWWIILLLFFFCTFTLYGYTVENVVLKRGYKDTLFIYFSNPFSEPLKIRDIYLNGEKVVAGKKNVFWVDILPLSVHPSEWGVVKIRYTKKGVVENKIKVKLFAEDGLHIEGEKGIIENLPLTFASYSFNKKLDRLYFYLRATDKGIKIKDIVINGVSFLSKSKIREIATEKGSFFILIISSSKPFKEGEYRIIKIITNKGVSLSPFRVIEPFFPIGMYRVQEDRQEVYKEFPTKRVAPEKWVKDCADHYINTLSVEYLCRGGSLNLAKKYNMRIHCWPRTDLIKGDNPLLLAWYIYDEPSGSHLPPMRFVKTIQRLRKISPKPTFIVDWSPTDLEDYNFVDILGMDVYPVFNDSLRVVEWYFNAIKKVASPDPVWVVVQAFRRNQGREKEWFSRFPTPEEERLLTFIPVSYGAKGVIYFAYNIEPREPVYGVGITKSPAAKLLWEEIRKINIEINLVRDLLIHSDVVPLKIEVNYPNKKKKEKEVYENKGPRGIIKWRPEVKVNSLISGEENIIFFLFNYDYEYRRESFIPHPVKNIDIKVTLPEWFHPKKLFTIDYKEIKEVNFNLEGRKLTFTIPELEVCKMIVLSRDASLLNSFKEKLKGLKKGGDKDG